MAFVSPDSRISVTERSFLLRHEISWLFGYIRGMPTITICLILLSLVPVTSNKEQNKDVVYTAAHREQQKNPSDRSHRNALELKANSTNMLKVFLLPFLSGGCQVLFQGNQGPSHLAESYIILPRTLHGCPRTSSAPRQEKQGKENPSLKLHTLLQREADRLPHRAERGIWR